MAFRSIVVIFVFASCFVLGAGQTPDAKKDDPTNATGGTSRPNGRDIPFPGGVDLQFLIKELARDIDLNVLFDSESFRPGQSRKTFINLKNVTAREAISYVLVQEQLIGEELGSKTLLIAHKS